MTTEEPPIDDPDYDPSVAGPVGVVVYGDGKYVKLKICELDEHGRVIRVLRGIAVPPDMARKLAERLTYSSWKVEDGLV